MSARSNTSRISSLIPSYASAEFRFPYDTPKLTRRTIKLTHRREVEVHERTSSTTKGLFEVVSPGTETTKRWSSEEVTLVEETYE